MMKNLKHYVLGASIALTFLACSKKQAEQPQPEPPANLGNTEVTAANVTYSNYIGNLLTTKCGTCHSGGIGGWTFSGLESVKSRAANVQNVTLVTMTMPKGGSLTAKEKELLKAWFDRNMPQ